MNESNEPSLSDPLFRKWLIEKVLNTDPRVWLDDAYFVSRLITSIGNGRSTRFNQQEREGGRNSALYLLKEEFQQEQGGTDG